MTSENNPLPEILAVLDAGDSLIIFPEGGRFPGPEPQKFKGGLFHLAKDRPQVQFVPVYLENLNRILPKGEILPVPLVGSITVGSPIRLESGETKAEFLDRARLAVWSLRLLRGRAWNSLRLSIREDTRGGAARRITPRLAIRKDPGAVPT